MTNMARGRSQFDLWADAEAQYHYQMEEAIEGSRDSYIHARRRSSIITVIANLVFVIFAEIIIIDRLSIYPLIKVDNFDLFFMAVAPALAFVIVVIIIRDGYEATVRQAWSTYQQRQQDERANYANILAIIQNERVKQHDNKVSSK